MHRYFRQFFVHLVFVGLGFATTCAGSTGDYLEETRTKIVELANILEKGSSPGPKLLSDLKRELAAITARRPALADTTHILTTDHMRALDSLYTRVERLVDVRAERDTLRRAIMELSSSFSRSFARHFYARGMDAQKPKLLLFSTSVSCECTLNMCAEQEAALHTFESRHPDGPIVIIIDAFEHFDLQRKHGVSVLPTLLLLDDENAELLRMEREEFDLDRITLSVR